jgi:D-specific alpha-keto acid dehydrogenase
VKEIGVEHMSTRSIGLNHIDLNAAAQLGITVENVAYAPDGVADFTVMLMLMAIRNAKETVTSANNYDFSLRSVRGRELHDMTVGVVGAGNIGKAVMRRLRGFGCRVLACDTRGQTPAPGFVSLGELLAESDIVTLHLPLTTETHHLIGRDEIATMKPGACLVNTGRGALVDTDALLTALEAGALGGAALDVLEGEEGLFYSDCRHRPIDNRWLLRLQRLPNVIVTPHTAYYTSRALHDVVEQTLVKCRAFESRRAHG